MSYPLKKATRPVAQLELLYTSADSLGNKQKELEATVLQDHNIVVITETWWDNSRDWSVAISGYKLFRRDRQGKRGGCVAIYTRKEAKCGELSLVNTHEQVESLWVTVRDQDSKGSLVISVYCRPTDQVEMNFRKTDVQLFRELLNKTSL